MVIKIKKNISILITILLSLTSFMFAYAQEINQSETSVEISDSILVDIPHYIIDDLISENPNSHIQIYEIIEFTDSVNDILEGEIEIAPFTSIDRIVVDTQKTVTNSDRLAKDEFKFSVARGQSTTITKEITGSLKGSVSSTCFNKVTLGADLTVTGKYSVGTTYSGPSDNSQYNSREFRMKFYEEVGTYKQTETTYYLTNKSPDVRTCSGKYTKPTYYVSYSVDKKI